MPIVNALDARDRVAQDALGNVRPHIGTRHKRAGGPAKIVQNPRRHRRELGVERGLGRAMSLMWPSPRPANTYGLDANLGCALMMSSASFGNLSDPAVPFSRGALGWSRRRRRRCRPSASSRLSEPLRGQQQDAHERVEGPALVAFQSAAARRHRGCAPAAQLRIGAAHSAHEWRDVVVVALACQLPIAARPRARRRLAGAVVVLDVVEQAGTRCAGGSRTRGRTSAAGCTSQDARSRRACARPWPRRAA